MREENSRSIKRIKAPALDTAALIKDNELTLIGRLTNPQEQKIWALLSSLPRKWNLIGRAVGSDLGNNCFQYRFEREEDLRRVLDNRPYHFAYWMVILQRWEPVISSSFPSLIPFWIKIKGLPLHYWQDDMVCLVGKELGTFDNHELTKTTARVRVFVDGLKPLIKECIVEFDSGEETPITLEYERLEQHCSYCYSLLHARKDCPYKPTEEGSKLLPDKETSWREPLSRNSSRVTPAIVAKPTRTEYIPPALRQAEKPRQREGSDRAQEVIPHQVFQERVDRHRVPYGERVSTKQKRVPPPIRPSLPTNKNTLSWRAKEPLNSEREITSPPYTKERLPATSCLHQSRELFTSRSLGQWRPKPATAMEENNLSSEPTNEDNPKEAKTPEPHNTTLNQSLQWKQ